MVSFMFCPLRELSLCWVVTETWAEIVPHNHSIPNRIRVFIKCELRFEGAELRMFELKTSLPY